MGTRQHIASAKTFAQINMYLTKICVIFFKLFILLFLFFCMKTLYDALLRFFQAKWPEGKEFPKTLNPKFADATTGNVVKMLVDTAEISYPTVYPTPMLYSANVVIVGQIDTYARAEDLLNTFVSICGNYLDYVDDVVKFARVEIKNMSCFPNLQTGATFEIVIKFEVLI